MLTRLLTSTVLVLSLVQYIFACSCMQEPLSSRVSRSSNVFKGKVLSSNTENGDLVYSVLVQSTCRMSGEKSKKVLVRTSSSSASCGVTGLQVNKEYSFLASGDMRINSCTFDATADWKEVSNLCKNSDPAQPSRPPRNTGIFGGRPGAPPVPFPPSNQPTPNWPSRPSDGGRPSPHVPPRPEGDNGEPVVPTLPVEPIPFHPLPSYPRPVPQGMSMRSLENEICNLCGQLRVANYPIEPHWNPVPIDPVPTPVPIVPKPMPPVEQPPSEHPIPRESCICPMMYDPVCSVKPDGSKKTYGNQCQAGCDRATILHKGPCEVEMVSAEGVVVE